MIDRKGLHESKKPKNFSYLSIIVYYDGMISFRIHWYLKRGHWDFRFCGFGYFLVRFFGFCAKKLRFWCSLRFADFPFFSTWFSVFAKNTNGFSRCGFWFFLFDLFGFRFLFDLSSNYAPPLISNSR